MMKTLSIWDQEELHYIAEQLIARLGYSEFEFYYDDEGNYIPDNLSSKQQEAFQKAVAYHDIMDNSVNRLNFRRSEELHWITFSEAVDMSLETVRERYLKDVLTKARKILRKGSLHLGYVPSEEIPDSYLDDLLALRWREELKRWAIQWDQEKEGSTGGALLDLSDFIWTEDQTERSVFLVMYSDPIKYALEIHFWICCGDTRIDEGQYGDLQIYLALRDREGGYRLKRAERFLEERDGEEVLDLAKLPDEINGIPVHKTAESQKAREQMRTRWGIGTFRSESKDLEVWRLEGYAPQ